MPCFDGRDRGDTYLSQPDPELVEAGNLLCNFMRDSDLSRAYNLPPSRGMRAWWERHKERDAVKKRHEEVLAKEKAAKEEARIVRETITKTGISEDTAMIKMVNGAWFHCGCGANMFRKTPRPTEFRCLHCGVVTVVEVTSN